MRICVFGAGSLGSALGGMLAQRNDVTLVGRKRFMDPVRRKGLRIVGDVVLSPNVKAFDDASRIKDLDLLIVSTKSYDTASAIRACRGLVSHGTSVLTLQNGLGNLELLREWAGRAAFGGTTTMGAALVSPGVVRVSGLGRTIIGSDLDAQRAREIAEELEFCGFRVEVERDVMRAIWGKAVINASINPTAAVLRVRNGELLRSKVITRFMREVCTECEQVASASHVSLPVRRMFPRVREVCMDTSSNVSSMLQDVLNGKRTEIGQINGAFCAYGKKNGVATPLNTTLVSMIEPLQQFSKGERLIS